jgi:tRNA threonylcarbamoyladenosine biosynthesis protein TsaB
MSTSISDEVVTAVQHVAGARALRVLALDTSTEACSAALLLPDGTVRLRCRITERSHADLILPMVDEVLHEGGIRLRELDGLAFGRGPGGFTGVRIAAGVVQGLAFGGGLRVAPVSSLASVAFLAAQLDREHSTRAPGVLVCNDARMNEVYWCAYRFDPADPVTPVALGPERVGPAASVTVPAGVGTFAGNGLERYPELRDRLAAAGLRDAGGLYPRADAVAWLGATMLARGEGVAAADALPAYVRDDVARPPAGTGVTGMS